MFHKKMEYFKNLKKKTKKDIFLQPPGQGMMPNSMDPTRQGKQKKQIKL